MPAIFAGGAKVLISELVNDWATACENLEIQSYQQNRQG
jgi:hypothetical protein